MNCEQVFDLLTRAPFPQGNDDDTAVEQHILACHECRQLAEALRPATDLIHEALSECEAEVLPSYRGWATSESENVATAVAPPWLTLHDDSQLAPTKVDSMRRKNPLSKWLWGFLAGACCMLFAMTASWSVQKDNANVESPKRIQLAALNLPAACSLLPNSEDTKSQPYGAKGLFCCSQCHTSKVDEKKRPPIAALAVVALTCTSCHEGSMPN